MPPPIPILPQTNFRNQRQKFGIRPDDRMRHICIIGRTAIGKTTLLKNLAVQHIQTEKGLGIIDPHG